MQLAEFLLFLKIILQLASCSVFLEVFGYKIILSSNNKNFVFLFPIFTTLTFCHLGFSIVITLANIINNIKNGVDKKISLVHDFNKNYFSVFLISIFLVFREIDILLYIFALLRDLVI